eukprot:3808093-Pyramimonas_sp.AAC.1
MRWAPQLSNTTSLLEVPEWICYSCQARMTKHGTIYSIDHPTLQEPRSLDISDATQWCSFHNRNKSLIIDLSMASSW